MARGIRKLLPADRRRDERVRVAVSELELETIRAAAARTHSSVSAFVRTSSVIAASRVLEAASGRTERLRELLARARELEQLERELEGATGQS